MTKLREDKYSLEKLRTLFFLAVVILTSALLLSVPRVLAPLAFAYVLNLIFSPMIYLANKFKLPRSYMALLVICLLGLIVLLPILSLGPVVNDEILNLKFNFPSIEINLKQKFIYYSLKIKEKIGLEISDVYFDDAIGFSRNSLTNLVLNLPNILGTLLEWFFVVPLFLYFFIKSGKVFRTLVLKLAPNILFERVYYFIFHFNKKIGDYVFAKFIEATIVGTFITLGFLIFKIKFAFIMGALGAVTNIIPYVGPFLGMVPAIILTLSEYGQGTELVAVIIIFLAANIIDLAVVFPLLVSKIVDLHPLVVVISVIVGSQYFGLVGMIISIPMVTAFKLVFIEIYRTFYSVSD